MPRREVTEAARRLAELLERGEPESVVRNVNVSIERREACEMLERIKPLVDNYAAIEEGSFTPSYSYRALRPVALLLEKLCRGASLDDEVVALALGVLGLLEKGRVERAAVIASVLESRLGGG
ncbi:hypothetical protein Pyrfu_0004 [Pyrolobus fumarii 1A]|uniref:Uncharacterized protein n=1 Tax=Pyrolobus fumarii (strain DSM 11204 / 1A) TaxID=694429 RepID=G0EDN9_PYRF1|nr:hypothetical protein [Pyrolobus fumarii]AEM37876.1 hypothetical protein Pyrfu_0004 [Pyrolobus fumarii 1A]